MNLNKVSMSAFVQHEPPPSIIREISLSVNDDIRTKTTLKSTTCLMFSKKATVQQTLPAVFVTHTLSVAVTLG